MAKMRSEHMSLKHDMLLRTVAQLQNNLSDYIQASSKMWQIISAEDDSGIFALRAFDNYMVHVNAVESLARRFNIHLQLNTLDHGMAGGSEPSKVVKETKSVSLIDDRQNDAELAIPLSTLSMTRSKALKLDDQLNSRQIDAELAIPLSALCMTRSKALKLDEQKYDQSGEKVKIIPAINGIELNILRIYVTHVSSVECFYAQIEKETNASIKPLYWSDLDLSMHQALVQLPKLNDLVLAQYEKDLYWYRAKILSIDNEKELFKVFYVDFGNIECVSITSLANCMLSEYEEPFRAVRFRMADVSDITGNNNCKKDKALQLIIVYLQYQTVNVNILSCCQSKSSGEDEFLIRFQDEEFADVPNILTVLGYAKQK